MAHNEVRNIAVTIESVLSQGWDASCPLGLCVVASTASTDGTDDIVRSIAARDDRVRLLVIPERRGKVTDVNIGVRSLSHEVIVIMDADVSIGQNCLPELVRPFSDTEVGLTTPSRAVAKVTRPRLGWRIGQLVAEIHNSLRVPKVGQVLAIRRELATVDERVSVDDAYQQWCVGTMGLRVQRISSAVVTSLPPATLREHLTQRRRVVAQYRTLREVTGDVPPTQSVRTVFAAALRTPTVKHRGRWDILLAGMVVELFARVLGNYDARLAGRDYKTWQAVASTKAL